jgi:hypothetical protein
MSTNSKTVKFAIVAVAFVLGAGCRKDSETTGGTKAAVTSATPASGATPGAPGKWKPLSQAQLSTLQAYDSNRNGALDPAERTRMEEERKARIDALKARINARYDRDGNGALDAGEMKTMQGDKDKLSVFKGAAMRRYDVNHDGTLDPIEKERQATERTELLQKAKAAMLAKYDANHDGRLDTIERAAIKQPAPPASKAAPATKTAPPAKQ